VTLLGITQPQKKWNNRQRRKIMHSLSQVYFITLILKGYHLWVQLELIKKLIANMNFKIVILNE